MKSSPLGETGDGCQDLVVRLLPQWPAARGAENIPSSGEEESKVVVNLRQCGDGASRMASPIKARLRYRQCRRQAIDRIDVGSGELVDELANERGKAFDVAALPLRAEGVEDQRTLPRAADSRHDNEFTARNVCIDRPEIVGSGTSDLDDVPHGWLGSFDITGLSGRVLDVRAGTAAGGSSDGSNSHAYAGPLLPYVTFGLESPARAFREGAF